MSAFPKEIVESTEELLKLVLRSDEVPYRIMDRALRSLRPAPQEGLDQYAAAIKLRLKQGILSNSPATTGAGSGASTGPQAVAAFEGACDKLRRCNPRVLSSMLTLLEPLSFPRAVPGYFQQTTGVSELPAAPAVGPGNPMWGGPGAGPEAASAQQAAVPAAPSSSSGSSTVHVLASAENAEADALLWLSHDVEDILLKDLLFIFQGIPGKHIKYDTRCEQYVIDPALRILTSAADTVYCLCELGWLYGRVHAYLLRAEREPRGVVVQAFCYALQAELHDYYRLLSVLEKEMNVRTSAKSASDGQNGNGGGEAAAASGLTLLRMRAWMQEPLERMLLLARLVDSAGPLAGGALASRLQGHTHNGDQAVQVIIGRIMATVCSPFYDMLTRWILHGELHDPHEEFFVGHRAGVTAANVWQDGYYLRMHMLPSFLSPVVAQKVLLVGKTINFMRLAQSQLVHEAAPGGAVPDKAALAKHAHTSNVIMDASMGPEDAASEGDLVSPAAAISVAAAALGPVMAYGQEEQLIEAIMRVSADTDARLLRLVEERYHIKDHLFALKQFLLLGAGDFIIGLLDSVGPELRKRASQLYRHNLTGMLEGALRSTNAQYMPMAVLDRLGVKLLEASPGDTGWEVFTLDYLIEPPLSAVVHKNAMRSYRTAFHMLWRLKRVEWTLSLGWKRVLLLTHSRGAFEGLTRLKAVLHRCSLNRSRMLHVVTTFSTYLMFEVLEVEWATLQDRLENDTHSLEDLIHAHDAYLNAIVERALLGAQHDELNAQLQRMLQSVLSFCALEDTLVQDAVSALARKRSRLAAAAGGEGALDTSAASTATSRSSRAGGGDWNNEVGAEDPNSYDGVPAYVVQRLDGAVRDYSQQFDIFMNMLDSHGDNHTQDDSRTSHIARFLALRLDFNGYHAKVKAEGKSSMLLGTPPVIADTSATGSYASRAEAGKTRLSF